MCKQTRQKRKKERKKRKKSYIYTYNIVLTFDGNLIPVYGSTDRAKVDYSVLQFAEVGGRFLLTHGRYWISTFKVFVFGSSDLGVVVL